jgi:hypothetical protein
MPGFESVESGDHDGCEADLEAVLGSQWSVRVDEGLMNLRPLPLPAESNKRQTPRVGVGWAGCKSLILVLVSAVRRGSRKHSRRPSPPSIQASIVLIAERSCMIHAASWPARHADFI